MNTKIGQQTQTISSNNTRTIDVIYDFTPDNEDDLRESAAGQDTMNTAKEIEDALLSMGHVVNLWPVTEVTLESVLKNLKGEVVFNQVEEDDLGEKALRLLEKMKKPTTGVDSKGFGLSWDKCKIKKKLIEAGVPTPKYIRVDIGSEPDTKGLEYPLFVKAADDHGSLSINDKSMVKDRIELISQIKWIEKTIGDDALVEEYIDGREIGITVLGNGVDMILLPAKEVLFGKEFMNKAKIVTFDSKWTENSNDYNGTMGMCCPADLTNDEKEAIEKAIRTSCRVLNVRDYARFDIRLKGGIPYVIDYNANPALGENDASGLPLKAQGFTYPEFISKIVEIAVKRYSKKTEVF